MSDDTGYELDDPKHPTYHERTAAYVDFMRKVDKESDTSLRPRPGETAEDTVNRVVNAVRKGQHQP